MFYILILITLLMPFFIGWLMGKQFILPAFIVALFLLLIGINTISAVIVSIKAIMAISFSIMFVGIGYAGYYAYRHQRFKIAILKKTFTDTLPLYVMLIIMFFIRMWFDHFNADALAYNDLSKNFEAQFLQEKNQYKIPAMYGFIGMFKNTINLYSIYGEFLSLIILSSALLMIVQEKEQSKQWVFWISIIVIAIVGTVALNYMTASLNIASVCLSAISILALRKRIKLLLLIPFAFTSFSFSGILCAPVIFIVILLKKKWTLKELFDTLVGTILFVAILAIVAFQINFKAMLILPVISAGFLLTFIPKFPEKEFNNFIYKKNLLEKINFNKKFKIAVWVLVPIIFIAAYATLAAIHYQGQTALQVFSSADNWSYFAIAVLFISAIFNKKMTKYVKIIIGFTISIIAYVLLTKISPSNSMDYISGRLSHGFVSMIVLYLVIWAYEESKWDKIAIKAAAVYPAALVFMGLSTYYVGSEHFFPIHASTNIRNNMSWINSSEEKVAYQYKDKMIYSDLPVFALKTVDKTMFNYKERMIFWVNMEHEMDSWITSWIKSIKEPVSAWKKDKDVLKKTIEYAQLKHDWKAIDKSEVFIFRSSRYANIVSKHYNKPIKNIRGVYVIEK